MDNEALMQVLQGVKRLAQGAKADALRKKYLSPAPAGPPGAAPMADPASPNADDMDGDPTADPSKVEIRVESSDADGDDDADCPPDDDSMDEDKIHALMGMLGK